MKIKKMTAALLSLAMLCPGLSMPVHAADAWRTAYQQILKANSTSATDDLSAVKYSLVDIVGDAIPELLLSDGEYHMAVVNVYTFYQGQAVLLGTMNESGEMVFDKTTGELITQYMSQGYYSSQRYICRCGELVPTLSLSSNEASADTSIYYKIDGKNVSQSAFEKKLSELNNHTYVFYGRDYLATNLTPVTSYKVSGSVAVLGDLNSDSKINASDASMILIGAASNGASNKTGLTGAQEDAADVNCDHKLNASDASIVLIYAAAVGSGQKNVTLRDFVK